VGRTTGWWGMVLFITTEATLFAALVGSYFYVRFYSGPDWPQQGIGKPPLTDAFVMTGLMLVSVLPVAWALRGIRAGRRGRLHLGLLATLALGVAFLVVDALSYRRSLPTFTPTTNAYGSLFYSIKLLDDVHVTVGLLVLVWLLAASLRGSFGSRHHERVALVALYWYFVVAVWVAVLFTVYLSVYL
jgi:cytochrome c oxidase subunit III